MTTNTAAPDPKLVAYAQRAFDWVLEQHDWAIVSDRVQVRYLTKDLYALCYRSDELTVYGLFRGDAAGGSISIGQVTRVIDDVPSHYDLSQYREDCFKGIDADGKPQRVRQPVPATD